MVEIPRINDIKNIDTYAYLGNIQLYGSDLFKDMEDVLEYYYSKKNKRNSSKYKVMHVQDLQHDSVIPTIIKDIFRELNKKFKVYGIAGIIAFDEKNGVGWHIDDCHVIAMNIIGNSTWFFRNGENVNMKPGDLLYVHKKVEHKVVSYESRFCVSFVWK